MELLAESLFQQLLVFQYKPLEQAENVEVEAIQEEVNSAGKSLGQQPMSYLLKSVKNMSSWSS